jgi:hypothetical protein
MKVKPNLFSISNNLDSLLAALLGFILILVFSKHSGIGVSPDSVTYLSSARHLLADHGFRSFDNLPTSDFPFAYPFFLTVISFITRLDPLQFGHVINGLLFGALIYTCGGIMNGFVRSTGWYKRILLAFILMNPALQEVYSYLWSETIFLILILFFVISISKYIRQPAKKWLFISVGICAVACETRYAGVFLVPTGLFLIFFNPEIPLRKRIRDCLLFGSLSVSLLLINMIRNYLLIGLAMGIRPKNEAGFLKILEYFGGIFCDWLGIHNTPVMTVFLSVFVLLIFTTIILYYFKRKNTTRGFEYIIAVTGLVYCIFMLFSYSLTRYEQFTNRLLSPLFIPILWSVSSWVPRFMTGQSGRMKWVTGLAALSLSAWFLNIQLAADWEYYDGVKDAGIPGYREDPFVQTEIVQYLQKNKNVFDPRFPVYSNAGDAFYFVTGLPALQLPFIDFPGRVEGYYNGYFDQRHEYLVWFQNEDNPQMPGLKDILKHKNMQLLKQLADGAVYITK